MHKFHCLIIAITLNLFCHAQNDSVIKRERNTHFSLFVGGVYSFNKHNSQIQYLNFKGPGSGGWRNITYNSSDEIGAMSTTIGFNIETREPNKNIFFKTGLSFTQINFQTKKNTTFYITRGGDYTNPNITHDTTQNYNIKKRHNFIAIPFGLNYHLPLSDSYLSFGGGYTVNFNYRDKIIETFDNQNEQLGHELHVRSPSLGLLFSISANCGIFFNISKNKAVGFELIFQPFFNAGMKYSFLTTFGNMVLKL